MISSVSKSQTGVSRISNLIWLAVFAYGVYLGIQYAPHFFDIKTIENVMDTLQAGHFSNPAGTAQEVTSCIHSQLNIDQEDDLRSAFTVRESGRNISVTAIYDWELDLLFEKKPMRFEKTLVLE